jgi:hypothetical protein
MDIQFGSVEAIAQAASYSDNAAAVLDLDTAAGYAQVGAKGGVGTSLGAKIRTVLNGVMKDAITIVASGLTITLLAGSTLAAQAVTGTTANFTAGLSTTAVTATGVISSSAGIIGRLDAAGISYGLQLLNVGGASQIGAVGFSVSSGAENSGNPVYKAAIGIQRSDVNGFGDLLFMVRNSNDTTSASLGDLKMRLSAAGVLTISGGLGVTAGTSALQAVTATAATITTANSNISLTFDKTSTTYQSAIYFKNASAAQWELTHAGSTGNLLFYGYGPQAIDFYTNTVLRGSITSAGILDWAGGIKAASLPTAAGATGTLWVDASGFVKRAP